MTWSILLGLCGWLAGWFLWGRPRRLEEAFDAAALHTADELFLASTTADVMPIVSVDGRSAGGGAPGPITRALVEAMAARMGRAVATAGR